MHMLLQRDTTQPPVQPMQLPGSRGGGQGLELAESHHKQARDPAAQQLIPGAVQIQVLPGAGDHKVTLGGGSGMDDSK